MDIVSISTTWKGIFRSCKFNLKLGCAEIYLITSIFGFSSKKNDFRVIYATWANFPI